MKLDARVNRIEHGLGMVGGKRPFVLLIGAKGGRKIGEAELQRRIEKAIRRQPKAKFIMLMCGGR